MSAERFRPDPMFWARKLHEAAGDLRLNAGTASALKLARRLERHAEAILFPGLPRWWADGVPGAASGTSGDSD